MERIGVRELGLHTRRYLERVKSGETIEVTDRGRPVALLMPTHSDSWQEMIAGGQVVVATVGGYVFDEPPLDYGIDASERLARLRAGT